MLLTRIPGQRGHMLIEAMIGGVVLALTVATVLTGISQASSQVGQALHSQQALELAQAQYDRLRRLPITHADWAVSPPVPPNPLPACPGAALPNSRWTCTLLVTEQADTITPALPGAAPAFRTARITLTYTPADGGRVISTTLELLKCVRC
jgi:Tfp pilus assembly protein PilV